MTSEPVMHPTREEVVKLQINVHYQHEGPHVRLRIFVSGALTGELKIRHEEFWPFTRRLAAAFYERELG